MPFTPFHMGIALAVKPFSPRRFSIITFCAAQIAMDIEPLIGLFNNAVRLHGLTHTFIGALLIDLPLSWIMSFAYTPIIRRINRETEFIGMSWLREPEKVPYSVLLGSALYGTVSHVFLDSLMHDDIRPFAPFSGDNPFLGIFTHDGIYHFCVAAGIAGFAAWLIQAWLRRFSRTT